jgi:hypothetical protein
VLPQKIVRNNLVALCAQIKALLNESRIQTKLTAGSRI